MKLLHPLMLCTLRNNMQFKAIHIEGSINMRADALSRFQMSPFREVASNADHHHAETPIEFLNIIFFLENSLAPSTVKKYQKGLKLFGYFRKEFGLKDIWPVPLQEFFFNISHLFNSGRSYSTVSCYLAGLSFQNKVYNFEDNTQRLIHNHWLSIIHYDCQPLAQYNSLWCT
jgi:hypothetical protein